VPPADVGIYECTVDMHSVNVSACCDKKREQVLCTQDTTSDAVE
jgi:hypothetical protein